MTAFLVQAYTNTFFVLLNIAPCRNRTRDILSTKQALYQNELMGRWKSIAASYLVAAVQVVAD
jgi:hypothetical protein